MEDINYEVLAKRLLGLMQLGGSLHGQDGHIWINVSEIEWNLDEVLRDGGISLNNKIYGGILESLDTIDEALKGCGKEPLEKWYDINIQFLGSPGTDISRIDKTERGEGGLY
jgi:hypothetical protein